MKKLQLSLLLITVYVLPSFAQKTSDWFVSVSSGAGWGGPGTSIKKAFDKAGYNQSSTFTLLFIPLTTDYPSVEMNVPIQVKFGRKIKENRSLYFAAGVSNSAKVSGFKSEGYTNLLIFGASYGTLVTIDYKVWQLGAGYQFSYPNTKTKLGIGPSLNLFQYKHLQAQKEEKHTAFVPGVALSGRLPLGKERRRIGVDVVAEATLAPPAKMKAIDQYVDTEVGTVRKIAVLKEDHVNMVHGMLGLALSIRK